METEIEGLPKKKKGNTVASVNNNGITNRNPQNKQGSKNEISGQNQADKVRNPRNRHHHGNTDKFVNKQYNRRDEGSGEIKTFNNVNDE